MVLRVGNSKTIDGNTEFNVYLRERDLYGWFTVCKLP